MNTGDDMRGRTVLVTGATDGLGRALAFELAHAGATVLVHGRNPEKCAALVSELLQAGAPAVRAYRADFASLAEVRAMAALLLSREDVLHVLVNNAGLGIGHTRQESHDGHELVFQVDHLAGHLLTHLLLPLLQRSAPARIVNVASAGQWPIDFEDPMIQKDWSGRRSYGQSKLAQISLTFEWARRLAGTGVTVNALHPASLMPTKMVVGQFTPLSTLEDGTQNVWRLVAASELEGVTGCYFNQDHAQRPHAQAEDPRARERLFALSDALCGISEERSLGDRI